eukprot:4367900-Prorocentrum_lima.AAC.1
MTAPPGADPEDGEDDAAQGVLAVAGAASCRDDCGDEDQAECRYEGAPKLNPLACLSSRNVSAHT